MKNRFKKDNGITMVALAITIIVLMILSAITISQVTNENGIVRKAFEAKDVQKQDQRREEEIMDEIRQEVNE